MSSGELSDVGGGRGDKTTCSSVFASKAEVFDGSDVCKPFMYELQQPAKIFLPILSYLFVLHSRVIVQLITVVLMEKNMRRLVGSFGDVGDLRHTT